MKTKKGIVIAVIAVIVIAIVVVLFLLKKRKNSGSDSSNIDQSDNTPTNSGGTLWNKNENYPLKYGDKGEKVKQLQIALNTIHNASLDVDGKFGSNTLQVLMDKYGVAQVDADLASKITLDYTKARL